MAVSLLLALTYTFGLKQMKLYPFKKNGWRECTGRWLVFFREFDRIQQSEAPDQTGEKQFFSAVHALFPILKQFGKETYFTICSL